MAHCKRCGKEEFLRGGLCYQCYQKYGKETSSKLGVSARKNIGLKKANQGEPNKTLENIRQIAVNSGKKIKILVIEDEPSVLESFKMILQIADIEVVTAPDGYAGLSWLSPDLDLVFTGFKMPGMNGFEVLKKIKESYPYMPVAIIAAYYPEGIRKEALEKGAFEYLRKPCLMEEIWELVERGHALRHKGG